MIILYLVSWLFDFKVKLYVYGLIIPYDTSKKGKTVKTFLSILYNEKFAFVKWKRLQLLNQLHQMYLFFAHIHHSNSTLMKPSQNYFFAVDFVVVVVIVADDKVVANWNAQ